MPQRWFGNQGGETPAGMYSNPNKSSSSSKTSRLLLLLSSMRPPALPSSSGTSSIVGVEFLAALFGPVGMGNCRAAEFSAAAADFAGGNFVSVPIAAAECSGNPDLAVAAGGRLIGGVPCCTFPKKCKTGGSALVLHLVDSLQPTGHCWGHNSSQAVAETMPVDSHTLKAVQLPSSQAIVRRLSVHSIHFFLSNASWLPPGRSTRVIACCM